ncbi:hypothetical protein [Brevundimonas vesicularis]|uniref:maleate cis-trans isomerase family protein n=1 Tax=Brevundimonas vesicularis TaxID=41276 RepID=UPI0038D3B136
MPAYGHLGWFGIGSPQSNPTVEPELSILMPRQTALYGTRLTSAETDPLARLKAYLVNLETTLETYDNMALSAFAFGCTGSSYLLGREAELSITESASVRFGYPVITAANAIVWGLERIGAKRIAIIAPYPEALIDAGRVYFEGRGLEVVRAERVVTRSTDTRTIYEISSDEANRLLESAPTDVDAILISGTGMPGLAAMAAYAERPVLSSNLCLAGKLLAATGQASLLDGAAPAGWQSRLAEAVPIPVNKDQNS